MFCKNCGVKLDSDAKFCSNCGIALSSICDAQDDAQTTAENDFASITIRRNGSYLGCAVQTSVCFNGIPQGKIANNSVMKYKIKSGVVGIKLSQLGLSPAELTLRIRPNSEPVITFSVDAGKLKTEVFGADIIV